MPVASDADEEPQRRAEIPPLAPLVGIRGRGYPVEHCRGNQLGRASGSGIRMRRQTDRSASATLFCIALASSATRCQAGWVDPDTPKKYHTVASDYAEDTREYELVSKGVAANVLLFRLYCNS